MVPCSWRKELASWHRVPSPPGLQLGLQVWQRPRAVAARGPCSSRAELPPPASWCSRPPPPCAGARLPWQRHGGGTLSQRTARAPRSSVPDWVTPSSGKAGPATSRRRPPCGLPLRQTAPGANALLPCVRLHDVSWSQQCYDPGCTNQATADLRMRGINISINIKAAAARGAPPPPRPSPRTLPRALPAICSVARACSFFCG